MSEPVANLSWGCCELGGDSGGYVTCATCIKSFHLDCIASTSSATSLQNWICPLCRGRPRGGNNDNTPLRSKENKLTPARAHKRAALSSPKLDAMETALTRNDVRDVVQGIFETQMENMFIRFNEQIKATVASALAPITKDIMDLQQSIVSVNEQYEGVIRDHTQMSDAVKKLQAENSTLRSENHTISLRLHQLEKNVDVQHVPETQIENNINTGLKLNKTFDDAILELQERSRREKNIIITGIPETLNKNSAERRENDMNEAVKIILSVYKDCPAPINSIRLGKYVANKNRHLKVFLDSSATVKTILKNRNSITGEYKMFSDQTQIQRNYINTLRDELSLRQRNGETDLVIKYIRGTPKIVSDISKNYNPPQALLKQT